MYEQEEKPKRKKSRAVANSVAQKKSTRKQGFGFIDNRHEAVSQLKLRELTDNNGLVQQASQLQSLGGNNFVLQQHLIQKREAGVIGATDVQMKRGYNLDKLQSLRQSRGGIVQRKITFGEKTKEYDGQPMVEDHTSISTIEAASRLNLPTDGLGKFSVNKDDFHVLNIAINQIPEAKSAIIHGLKLTTAKDFKSFIGSLKLNFENIQRGMGQTEETPLSRDLSVANFPNTIEEVLEVIPHNARVRVLIPIADKAQVGVEYNWNTADGTLITIRMHSYELERKKIGIESIQNAAKGWVYRAIVGGQTMDIHGQWHTIENIQVPEAVKNPGGYTGTSLPNAALPYVTTINGIIASLVADVKFPDKSNKEKDTQIRTQLKNYPEIAEAVTPLLMRNVRDHILQTSKHNLSLRDFQLYQLELQNYETIMNDIHIPLI